jgi:DNA-binding transcriptional LysR family regulator
MELRHLRYFIGVAEELHFGRAAARLGISQPPLSHQIHALEDELGVRLFDRSSRNVELTNAGMLFLTEARATLAQAERAITVARRAAMGEVGELAIGFNASAPFVPKVARAIFDFRQGWPAVHLTLAELPRDAQLRALADGTIDVGITRSFAFPSVGPGITATPLLEERLVVALRPDHRLARQTTISLADLRGEPLVVYSRDLAGGFTDELFSLLRSSGVEPEVAQDVREVSTLFGLVSAGVGVTVMAESLCALQAANLVYRPLSDESARSALWVLHLNPAPKITCLHFLDLIQRPDVMAFPTQPS